LAEFFKSPWTWVALVPVGFFALLFCTAIFEQTLVRFYVPAPDDENFLAPIPGGQDPQSIPGLPRASQVSDYVATISVGIHAAGFAYHGLVAHAKAPRIQILATLWMSPDRRMIVISGSGAVLKMASYQTQIYTPLQGGKWLVTSDSTGAGDPSRQFKYKRVVNVLFPQLLEAHMKQMAKYGPQVREFSEANAMDALFALYDEHVRLMVKRGLARYLDAEKTRWSYTPKAGLLVCLEFFEQLGAAMLQFWRVQRKPVASPELKTRMASPV
jgi:hypothetical protein